MENTPWKTSEVKFQSVYMRQRYLAEILDAPGNDGVVVEGHVEGHNGAGQAQPPEVHVHLSDKIFKILILYLYNNSLINFCVQFI